MSSRILLALLAISLIVNGFFFYNQPKQSGALSSPQKEFSFLSKRIFAEDQNDILINFIPLRQELRDYIGKQDEKVGAYFEYLPSGTSIGVNDKEEVQLASLAKIPIVMSILKKTERRKIRLSDTLIIEAKHLDQGFGTLWKRGEGTRVSVEELVRLALIESDNTAFNVLINQLEGRELNEIYQNLDITITINPNDEKKYLQVSPKNYSSIFRSLYLSSFLSRENSNYILNLLTQTTFNNKIVAGVPNATTVAHKIGVFEELDTSKNVFIDCGIIYVPNRPYILCAFVQDSDQEAQKHISYISQIIYNYVSEVKSEK